MATKKFKTNIKCTGCIATVTPFLNESAGEGNWSVDLQNPERTLTVEGTDQAKKVIDALAKAGYKAEEIG